MTNELLKPVADALQAPTAVGSGDLLGVVVIVIDIICLIYLLVIWYQFEREEHQFRRQCDQYYGKRNNNPRENNDASARNLGELRSHDKNLGLVAGNAGRHGVHNPGIIRKLRNRLAMLFNLILKMLDLAHIRKTPNEKS